MRRKVAFEIVFFLLPSVFAKDILTDIFYFQVFRAENEIYIGTNYNVSVVAFGC